MILKLKRNFPRDLRLEEPIKNLIDFGGPIVHLVDNKGKGKAQHQIPLGKELLDQSHELEQELEQKNLKAVDNISLQHSHPKIWVIKRA